MLFYCFVLIPSVASSLLVVLSPNQANGERLQKVGVPAANADTFYIQQAVPVAPAPQAPPQMMSKPVQATPLTIFKHIPITIRNSAKRNIQVAVRFLSVEGEWVTKGWYKVEEGKEIVIDETDNQIIYVYAESLDTPEKRIRWDGKDNKYSVRGSKEEYGFRERRVTMKSHEIVFSE